MCITYMTVELKNCKYINSRSGNLSYKFRTVPHDEILENNKSVPPDGSHEIEWQL